MHCAYIHTHTDLLRCWVFTCVSHMHQAAASGAHDHLCLCPSQRSEERYGERCLAPRLLLSFRATGKREHHKEMTVGNEITHFNSEMEQHVELFCIHIYITHTYVHAYVMYIDCKQTQPHTHTHACIYHAWFTHSFSLSICIYIYIYVYTYAYYGLYIDTSM